MKFTKFIVSSIVIIALQSVSAVNLGATQNSNELTEGIRCSTNALGEVACEISPIISLEGTGEEESSIINA